ncbi:dienelactone hydrolase family protein [Acuticoccus sp. M5D2P5]|uniref:dienelactone hydrolase family protein n=1 Tax=Acuticoccus kalidii TaxID=2910977 RepID=UPI001F2ABC03|nr:dienelactone hydrolase family protein [Acuticoccus kalidii]MCF3935171.1 dienelactone hydrolase family protein [Acuticoccus kalidii]
MTAARFIIFLILIVVLAGILFLWVAAGGATVAKEHARRVLSPAVSVPHPTGAHRVGLQTLTLSIDGTAIPVDVWYPSATPTASLSQKARGAMRTVTHPTHASAQPGAPLARATKRLPLIVYFPAWFSTREDNSYLLADLASHGFVILALDDIVHNRGLGDPRLLDASLDYGSDEGFARSLVLAGARVHLAGVTAARAVDDFARQSPWAEAVDTGRIGALGFSFGGSSAAEFSKIDPRVAAVVNMEGSTYGASGESGVDVPYLFLSGGAFFTPVSDLASPDGAIRYEAQLTKIELARLFAAPETTETLVIPPASHVDFSDRRVWPGRADAAGDPLARAALSEAIHGAVIGFFETTLGDERHAPLAESLPDVLDLDTARALARERGSILP